jgi:5-methylcytosine-specific restriction endonuclease McrA
MPTAPKIVPLKPKYQRPPRKTTSQRGYGSEHERVRARLLAEHQLCQRCERDWSKHYHHRDRNTFNRAWENAEALCEACHQAEHNRRPLDTANATHSTPTVGGPD